MISWVIIIMLFPWFYFSQLVCSLFGFYFLLVFWLVFLEYFQIPFGSCKNPMVQSLSPIYIHTYPIISTLYKKSRHFFLWKKLLFTDFFLHLVNLDHLFHWDKNYYNFYARLYEDEFSIIIFIRLLLSSIKTVNHGLELDDEDHPDSMKTRLTSKKCRLFVSLSRKMARNWHSLFFFSRRRRLTHS